MNEPEKPTEWGELSPEALALIKWQEENPDVWDMKGEFDENGVDLARLRENMKLTPAERLRRMGAQSVFVRQGAKTRTIRELGGEIWSELSYKRNAQQNAPEAWTLDAETAIVDLIMSVLARHTNTLITMDQDLPVLVLPTRDLTINKNANAANEN